MTELDENIHKDDTPKSNPLRKWAPLGVIIALMASAYAFNLHHYFDLNAFHEHKEFMQNYVAEHPLLSGLIFVTLYIAAVALSLPIATILTLSGGFLFGLVLGALYVISAATMGATIIFTIAKTSLGDSLRQKASGLYERIEGNMNENAVGYLLFMRLVPIFPFVLVNIAPALFNVKTRVFVLTTFFGIMPGSVVFVNLGQQLGEITSLKDLVSMETLLAFALLGFFALIPNLYKMVKGKKAAAALALMAICSFSVSAQASSYGDFLELYDGLLSRHTRPAEKDGTSYMGVAYTTWGKDARHAKALSLIQATNPKTFETAAAKMAFWINAYNFLTIDLIIREDETQSIKNLGGLIFSPWKKHTWRISGKSYTLDHIEHKILRKMGDPRIHFAINCASVSCPDLRPEAYHAGRLDDQLRGQTLATLTNATKGLNETDDAIMVSKIFDWFKKDFYDGDAKAWIEDNITISSDKPIAYMEYDWSLNAAH